MKLLIKDFSLKYKTMLSYCVKRKKNTESINPRVSKTNGKTMILSKCAICVSKKSRFIKKQEASGILSNPSLKTPLNKIPLLGGIFFWTQFHWMQLQLWMKFLLAGYKFMPEMDLKQPGFTYSACGPFTKSKKKNSKIWKNRRYKIYLQKWTGQSLFSAYDIWRF